MKDEQSVYFARCIAANGADMDAIKIGCSWGPVSRLKAVASNVPFDCELVCMVPGTVFHEYAVHMWFRAEKITGEYFKASPSVLAFVEAARSTGRLPLRIRQVAKEGAWIDMAGAKAFMALHGLSVADAAAISGTRLASYKTHSAKDPRPNRRFAAALTVAALERGHTVNWPSDFIAPVKTKAAA